MSAVRFEIPRVPPSWSNRRQFWAERYSQQRAWREEAWLRGAAARGEARINPAKSLEGPRCVSIVMHRIRLLDTDNAYSACKPILDGIRDGGLIYDDSPRYCELSVTQQRAATKNDEHCEIEVTWPADTLGEK